ncbi:hypothetical protein [Actinomadura algeriensis]|uniref:SUKH-3 immunity protein of toxin-antitoxin system n=1 Tax=Actinomadura algeriensis TaxID=1679523 RepID=A0ABR9JP20_9ACTN|nr:hypothetical protein [Actinomadura algeriensis]MBE1532309.1 hypothetical protein [Actinomadura algeriensis]
MEHDLEGVLGDAEAVERHARANVEALRAEVEAVLRAELSHIGWQETVLVERRGKGFLPGRSLFTLTTSTKPPGKTYAWEGPPVEMPGVPLEVVRAAKPNSSWAPGLEGERWSWGALVVHLTDEATRWEMYLANILAFLADVAARGGPRVEGRDLSVDVDAAGGDDVEPYWVPVGGEKLTVFMHGDVLGRDSGEEVGVVGDFGTWSGAVDMFVEEAARLTS